MIAYLMCAGTATRLRPLTDKTPKCLLTIDGIPILEHWLNALIKTKRIDKIYVNVHHCAEKVESWLRGYSKNRNFKINVIDERSALLGTAGTLFWHGDTDQDFMIAYTDTFSPEFFNEVPRILNFWKSNPDNPLSGLITMPMPNDSSAGAIETDFMGNITSFKEKEMFGLMAWSGIAFCRKEFYNYITKNDHDLARDVFPKLCGKIRVISHVKAYDIGRSLEDYARINKTAFQSSR